MAASVGVQIGRHLAWVRDRAVQLDAVLAE